MSLLSLMARTAMIGGAASAVVAVALIPSVRRRIRPMVKDAVKGGLVAIAAFERQWAELVEEVEDLAAEINFELTAGAATADREPGIKPAAAPGDERP
ncbi:MAG: DUF5132 domain-containing protein [Alphaproteobacteria bacterium]|nr:DUF5132 domain-containing protein [Alphaproteobacteria bacterium]